jgi:hypothetical protein
MTLEELKAQRLSSLIEYWEARLRQVMKYGETPAATWEEVREMYYGIRNELLQVDLLDEDF